MRRGVLVGYAKSTAAHANSEIMSSVERSFGPALRKAIPVQRIILRLRQGLDAMTVKVATFGRASPGESRKAHWSDYGLKMPSAEDKAKATILKREVETLRAKRNDPATPRSERARLKLQIETRIWEGQRLDPELFKSYRWRS